jgi:hypothetical protein
MAAELNEMVRKQLLENINQGRILLRRQHFKKGKMSSFGLFKYLQEILRKFAVFWMLAK